MQVFWLGSLFKGSGCTWGSEIRVGVKKREVRMGKRKDVISNTLLEILVS